MLQLKLQTVTSYNSTELLAMSAFLIYSSQYYNLYIQKIVNENKTTKKKY